MRTPAYIQIVGLYNQNMTGVATNDGGGELDPHGADLAGNPLGGLVYSNGFNGANGSYVQTQSWNHFIDSNKFCFKACNPAYSTNLNYCQK